MASSGEWWWVVASSGEQAARTDITDCSYLYAVEVRVWGDARGQHFLREGLRAILLRGVVSAANGAQSGVAELSAIRCCVSLGEE